MKPHTRHLHYFLFSQYLADGVRTTAEIILPVIICSAFGRIDIGFTLALGALCVSISDAPGPVEHKRNGMLYCNFFVFLMALITGLAHGNFVMMAVLVIFSSFFFTMLSVFGNRSASVGTASLLVMVLRMYDSVTPYQAFTDSLIILAGGTWYMVVALLFYRLTPYRPAQRSLGDCIHETAKIVRIKARLYDTNTNFEEEYRSLVEQQTIVNEKQEAVRELLYKNRELTKEHTRSGKILLIAFSDLMDLYEQINATWYDYQSLRKRFAGTGILTDISKILNRIADEIDHTGLAIQANGVYQKHYDPIPELNLLKDKMDALDVQQGSKLVLRKILVNLRSLGEKKDELMNYFRSGQRRQKVFSQGEYSKFVSHQQIDFSLLRNNMHLDSSVFRHSLRMMVTCAAGFFIAQVIPFGQHSYWILLTIIIILKPGFGLTRQRNRERLFGTIAGGVLGIGVLLFVSDRDVLFGFIAFFMLGTYTYQRLNYGIMVIFTTPYVLILFHLLGMGTWNVAGERLLDTGIGCALAFLSNHFLFPHWEAKHFMNYMASALKANIDYLSKLKEMLSGKKIPALEYKLVRKELYVSIANLSAAFHRMLTEPKSKQQDSKRIYEFVVLNHVLSSNVASLSSQVKKEEAAVYPPEASRQVQRTIRELGEVLQYIDATPITVAEKISGDMHMEYTGGDKALMEQLVFIHKISADMAKITRELKV